MKRFPDITKKDADDLIDVYKEKHEQNPFDANIDAAMIQTLARGLHEKSITPEFTAYVIEALFDQEAADDVDRFQIDPELAELEMIVRMIYEKFGPTE